MYILKYASSCTRTKLLLSKNKKKVCGIRLVMSNDMTMVNPKSKLVLYINMSNNRLSSNNLQIKYIYTLSKYMDTKFYSYTCKYLLQSSAIHYIKGNY